MRLGTVLCVLPALVVTFKLGCNSKKFSSCEEFLFCCGKQCSSTVHKDTSCIEDPDKRVKVNGVCKCSTEERRAPSDSRRKSTSKKRPPYLTKRDFENIKHVPKSSRKLEAEAAYEVDEAPPEFLEGDMLVKRGGILMMDADDQIEALNMYRPWKNGVVPYVLEPVFNDMERAMIARAIALYQKYTCIRFVKKTTETSYVSIQNGSACAAEVGERIQRHEQVLMLSPLCIKRFGSVLHEMMHMLGFIHEHSRHDRDKYVKLFRENIKEDRLSQFEKYEMMNVTNLGLGYDFNSVMHYPPSAFSKQYGLQTIVPRNPKYAGKIGQRTGLSVKDIQKVNLYYKCPSKGNRRRYSDSTTDDKARDVEDKEVDNGCSDYSRECGRYADSGMCADNPDFMQEHCCRSCRNKS